MRGMILVAAAVAAVAAGCTYESSVDVPGPLEKFDPVAALPQVAAYAGPKAELVSIRSVRVSPTGTQDFTASYFKNYWGGTSYQFIRPATTPVDESQPIGVRPARADLEGVEVEVLRPHWRTTTRMGGGVSSRTTAKHRGMNLKLRGHGSGRKDVVPWPRCSFAKLWAAARRNGAPANAVASIDYDKDGYRFSIDNTKVSMRFDESCALVPAGAPRPRLAVAAPPADPQKVREAQVRGEAGRLLRRDAKQCLERSPGATGQITLLLRVGASGAVEQATAPAATVPAAVKTCLLAAAKAWKVSPGAAVTVSHNLNLR